MKKILLFGEPLIRITPLNNQKIGDNCQASMFYGGSEINIARTLAGFNQDSKIFTALPNNEIGKSFLKFFNNNQIDTSNICLKGKRIGLYYLENGYGIRNSEVYYDRQYTSIDEINEADLDIDNIFKDISHFHFSGITVAISSKVRNILQILLEEAKKRNIIISMDLNLRTKMISVSDAKKEFSYFAKYADYCFGIEPLMINDQDLSMFNRNKATQETIKARMEALKEVFGFRAIFHTVRNVDENNVNKYQCYCLSDQFYKSITLKTPLLERVGSGDAFVAGALYQIINNASWQETIDFAVASGTLKCTIPGDSMYENTSKVKALLQINLEISR